MPTINVNSDEMDSLRDVHYTNTADCYWLDASFPFCISTCTLDLGSDESESEQSNICNLLLRTTSIRREDEL